MGCIIEAKILFRHTDYSATFFHPKVTLDQRSGSLVMTLQTIGGSDYYGPVRVSYSTDRGESWSSPELISPLGSQKRNDGVTREGTCDVVPDYHPQTDTILAIGHNVYYRNDGFLDTHQDFTNGKPEKQLQRYGVYCVRDRSGNWSERRRLSFAEFSQNSSFVCGCTQKLLLPDGNLIIPFTFGNWDRKDRQCCSILCKFDGNEISLLKRGNILKLPVNRGLLEPSLATFAGKFYMTLRAEDQHGYFSVSEDGLNWGSIQAWRWEDGESLIVSTTQQHWMELGGKLYLIYTRDAGFNHHVIRWRAPLLMAEFDPHSGCLKKNSEQTVFPLRERSPEAKETPLMGNFHPCRLSENEGIITVGENIPSNYSSGNTLLARVKIQ